MVRANGLKSGAFNFLIVALAAFSDSLAIKIVGALLIGVLMVIPVITSMQFKKGFGTTVLIAIFISFISVVGGLFISYYLGWASGGTIVIVALAIFLTTLFARRKNG